MIRKLLKKTTEPIEQLPYGSHCLNKTSCSPSLVCCKSLTPEQFKISYFNYCEHTNSCKEPAYTIDKNHYAKPKPHLDERLVSFL